MKIMILIEYFTDASYSPQQKISVIGFKIRGCNTINTEKLIGINSTQSEILGIQRCVDHFANNYNIETHKYYIYTDCQRGLNLPIIGKIIKIDGHKPSRLKSKNDLEFSKVDKYVRKELRRFVRSKSCS